MPTLSIAIIVGAVCFLFGLVCGVILREAVPQPTATETPERELRPKKSVWTVLERRGETAEHWLMGRKMNETMVYITLEQDQYGNLRAWQDDENERKAVNAPFWASRYGFTNIKSMRPPVF